MKIEIKVLILFGIIISGILILGNILPIYATHDEPFEFTWTIINYYSSGIAPVSQLEQEQAIERRFQVWADELNMNLVFIPNAAKSEVYCWATFESLRHIGAGGGDPGKWCQFTIGSNQRLYVGDRPDSTFIHRNLEAIAGHESGHAFGLTHKSVGSCIMFSNYGDGVKNSPCAAELKELQLVWSGIENPPAIPETDGAIVITAPTQVTRGDIVSIPFTLENLGNIDYNQIIWFYDITSNTVIQSGPFYNLKAGEIVTGVVLWDTSTVTLGIHEVRGHWLTIAGEIDILNNRSIVFVDVVDSVIPLPDPEPEPIPDPEPEPIPDPEPEPIPDPEPEPVPDPVNYFIDYEETISITDLINVTHIIGPDSRDQEIQDLKDTVINLIVIIDNLIIDKADLNDEVARLQAIIDQIIILVTPSQ